MGSIGSRLLLCVFLMKTTGECNSCDLNLFFRRVSLQQDNSKFWFRSYCRYSSGSLDDFIESGGFSYLPEAWQHKVDFDEGESWYEFLFGTMERTKEELQKINIMVLGVYLAGMVLLNVMFISLRRANGSVFLRSVFRLVLTHGTVVLVAGLALQYTSQTNWAKDIRSGKAYRLPAIPEFLDMSYPGTLALEDDTLIAPHFAADFLASYGRVIDVAHPGNQRWKREIQDHSVGYDQLLPALQEQLSRNMIRWINEHGRFLTLNAVREWTEVTDEGFGEAFLIQQCHKELMMATNPLLEALVRQLDSLESETNFGRWRDMSIHESTIPNYLKVWKDILVPPVQVTKAKKVHQLRAPRHMIIESPLTIPRFVGQKGLPTTKEKQEPFPGAWIVEGTLVEGMYECKYNDGESWRFL
jgi:hypothetical protein